MKTFEDKKTVVNVPENWEDITLDVYETFRNFTPSNNSEKVEFVARVCSTEAETLRAWPSEIFDRIVTIIDFVFRDHVVEPRPSIKINGVTYVIPVEDKLSLGAFVDADEAQKEDRPLANILAITCRPALEEYDYDNNLERANMFGAQPMTVIQPLLSFFLHYKDVLTKHTKVSTDLAEAVAQLPQNIKLLQKRGGGISLSQTWRAIRYKTLIWLLNYRLRKFLRLSNIPRIEK